jgi:uncharacterized membrane protein YbhN (UPF0104 family)
VALLRSAETRGGRIVLGAAQLLFTVVVTWVVLDRVGWQLADLAALGSGALQPRMGLLVASCVLLLAGYVLSAVIWAWVITDLGGGRLPWFAATEVYMVANLARYLPGKVWQIAGVAYLSSKRGIPATLAAAAAVLGQAVSLGAAAIVGAASLSGVGEQVSDWSIPVLVVLAAALLVSLVPGLQAKAMTFWFRLARREAPQVRPSAGTTLRWLALYTINWMLYGFAFLVLVKSLELPGDALLVSSAFAAAWVLGYAFIFAPAGIGVRESFLVLFLTPQMGVASASVVSIVARVWTTVVELVPAAMLWVVHARRALSLPQAGDASAPTDGVAEPPPPGVP